MAPTLGDCLTRLTAPLPGNAVTGCTNYSLFGGSCSARLIFSGRLQFRRNNVPTGTPLVKQGRLHGTNVSADTLSNLIGLQLAWLV